MKRALLILLLLIAAKVGGAAELKSARIIVEPPEPYVGETFSLTLEVVTSNGAELQNISLQRFPQIENTDFGALRPLGAINDDEGKTHRYRATCVSQTAGIFAINSRLDARLVTIERRGFFSYSSAERASCPIEPLSLVIRALPGKSAPVGNFEMSGSFAPKELAPGEIVTLEFTLRPAAENIELPKLDETLFKTYPPTITRSDEELRVTQVVIPLTTNSTTIAGATFDFFEPRSGTYQTARAPEAKLRFIERAAETNEVKIIGGKTETGAKKTELPAAKALREKSAAKNERRLETDEVMRIAPANAAKPGEIIPAGTAVRVLEVSGAWERVEVGGKRGWIKQ